MIKNRQKRRKLFLAVIGILSLGMIAACKGNQGTKTGAKPETPIELNVELKGDGQQISWTPAANAKKYNIYRADSRFGSYEKIDTAVKPIYLDKAPNDDKYANYYQIEAVNQFGISEKSEPASLEMQLFGKNTIILSETDQTDSINKIAAQIYLIQKGAQFGSERYAIFFKPGDYTETNRIQIGFYTHIAGLGKTPLGTRLSNIETPAFLADNNATCNFWRVAENLSIVDTDNKNEDRYNFKWAVSQAAPLRRMNIERRAQFDWNKGWASGGYAADCIFRKPAGSYTQQQYYTRNSVLKMGAYGINWNGFYQGVTGAPEGNWQAGADRNNYTNIAASPVIREKPFLYLDDNGEYQVFVPSLKKEAAGVSWSEDNIGEGNSFSLDNFYIAKPELDGGASLNEALKAGKHILFTPGIYHLEEALTVKNPDTILLGIGLATLIPDNDKAAIIVNDVDGVTIAGLILDAGASSKHLLVVGEVNSEGNHSDNPTLLSDLFLRIGGVHEGTASADIALEINSNDVIGDHFWIWRADHGDGVGWGLNKSRNGLVVNGDNMTMYGLFNEHFQEYQTLWNGENGRMYFYQCETPYDPQNQEDWMSHEETVKGYAAYKVADGVKKHYAAGLGIYGVLIHTNGASIFLTNAIEVPEEKDVTVENACIVELGAGDGPLVGIHSIINGMGEGTSAGDGGKGFAREFLLKYNNGIVEGNSRGK